MYHDVIFERSHTFADCRIESGTVRTPTVCMYVCKYVSMYVHSTNSQSEQEWREVTDPAIFSVIDNGGGLETNTEPKGCQNKPEVIKSKATEDDTEVCDK